MNETGALRTDGLTKRYGHVTALRDLDLSVDRGEVYGFLGPNGAGKSTTIRLLLDLIRPTAGRVRVLGLDPRTDGVRLRRRIGYLPGELRLADRQTGHEVLTFLANLRGGVRRTRVDDLADRFDLDLSKPVRGLSKGNKQKIGLVQAFMHDPELLILDEPTSGLDPLLQQQFLALVREARADGRTVFMSSHVLSEVQDTADRVAILRDGRLVTVHSVTDLAERAMRRVELRFDAPVDAGEFTGLPGVHDVRVRGSRLSCVVDGVADRLVKAAARHTVLSLLSHEPDLEEMFLTYYTDVPEAEHHAA